MTNAAISAKIEEISAKMDSLIVILERNDNAWSMFFEIAREKMKEDPAFASSFITTVWGGIYAYDSTRISDNDNDEQQRQKLDQEIYDLAVEIKQ